MTGVNGQTRSVRTSSFGYYSFADVALGQTYTIAIASKRYQFMPIVVNVFDELSNLMFVGIEN